MTTQTFRCASNSPLSPASTPIYVRHITLQLRVLEFPKIPACLTFPAFPAVPASPAVLDKQDAASASQMSMYSERADPKRLYRGLGTTIEGEALSGHVTAVVS